MTFNAGAGTDGYLCIETMYHCRIAHVALCTFTKHSVIYLEFLTGKGVSVSEIVHGGIR